MVSGTVHGHADSFRTQRILIAAKYGNSSVKLNSNFKSIDLGSKSPFHKVPVFETSDGKSLWETHSIACFVSKPSICCGKDEFTNAEINQWTTFADSELLPLILSWVLPSLSVMAFDKKAVDLTKADVLCKLQQLDEYLLTRTYLVGERISLADVTVACNLILAFQNVLEPDLRKQLMNVTRWFETCVNQPEFKSVLGAVKLCEKAAAFDGKKFKELQGDAAGDATPATGGKKKDNKSEEKPKEPKKKEKKTSEPAEEMDEADLAVAEESKKKDPFEGFPKSAFNMDEFKRTYSNEDTITVAIPYFWKNFDKENFSVWYCEYKFPEELTLTFMSCNLIAGMFQRLDKLRKNAFGSMCLFGTDNNSTISGVWFWRGQDLAFELSPDWQIDYSSYEWKKMNPEDAKDKKTIDEYFAWEGDFGGKKFNQGKIFK